jgi:hypothetical protein
MYFVFASTSGGGVGSSLPRNDKLGVYDFVVGFTGLLGRSERSFSLIFGALFDFGAAVTRPAGAGVGRIWTGRAGAETDLAAAPGRGPGEGPPLGPGLGALPAVLDTAAARVGLGFGTPACSAGGTDARAAGAALALGAGLARATAAALGVAFGTAGAGVTAFALGLTTGAGGLGEGRAEATLVGAGDGAAVGGGFIATAIGAVVETLTGAAGSSFCGCVSKMFCVGCGFGCGLCCGIGRGFGGAVGAVFASSCRLTGKRCACGCASGAWRTGATTGACGTGIAARLDAGWFATTIGDVRAIVTISPPAALSVAPSCDELARIEKSNAASSAWISSETTKLAVSRSGYRRSRGSRWNFTRRLTAL